MANKFGQPAKYAHSPVTCHVGLKLSKLRDRMILGLSSSPSKTQAPREGRFEIESLDSRLDGLTDPDRSLVLVVYIVYMHNWFRRRPNEVTSEASIDIFLPLHWQIGKLANWQIFG